MMAEANAVIETITVEEALRLVDDPGTVFVDIREKVELSETGRIKGASHAPRGHLEFHADPDNPRHMPALSSGKRIVLQNLDIDPIGIANAYPALATLADRRPAGWRIQAA